MTNFFLKISLSLFMLVGSAHALLITPQKQAFDKSVETSTQELYDASLAQILITELGDISATDIERLPVTERPARASFTLEQINALPEANRPVNAQLPMAILSLIASYTIHSDIYSNSAVTLPIIEEDDEKEEEEKAEAAALPVTPVPKKPKFPLSKNGTASLASVQNLKKQTQIKKNRAESEKESFYAEMAKIKRNFIDNHRRLPIQEYLFSKTIFTNTMTGDAAIYICIKYSDKKLFSQRSFALRFPRLYERLHSAFFGAMAAESLLLCYTIYQLYDNELFCNPFPDSNHSIPKRSFINGLTVAGYYMLLDIAHKYGTDILNNIIDFKKYKKYEDALQAYLADPDIDINYNTVKNRLGWHIKTFMAYHLATTRV